MEIEIMRYVNFSINIVGTLVIFMIIACLSTGENRGNRLNKLFIRGLFACIAYMLGEALAWRLKGSSNLIWLIRIANDTVFLSGYVILITFTDYLLAYLSEKNSVPRRIMMIMYLLGGAGALFVIANHLTGAVYTIDAGGYYHRGNTY